MIPAGPDMQGDLVVGSIKQWADGPVLALSHVIPLPWCGIEPAARGDEEQKDRSCNVQRIL
jgi:hypothetical protein